MGPRANRAEITRTVNVDIEQEGIQDIVVHNMLTESIVRKDSISVRGGDKSRVILEVAYERTSRKEVQKDDEDVKKESLPLQEKKNEFLVQRKKLSAESKRIRTEKKWIESYSNNLLQPSSQSRNGVVSYSPISIEQAREFMAFYKTELERLDGLEFALQAKNADLDKQISDVNDEIRRKRPVAAGDKSQVTISLAAKKTGKVSLLLSYVILGASWESVYDARVDSKQKSVGLVYNAMIKNTTGENWENVDLFLSTAVPSVGGEPPLLVPLKVDWKTVADYGQRGRTSSIRAASVYSEEESISEDDMASFSEELPQGGEGGKANKPNLLTAGVEAGATSATYQIRRKSTIESDDKPHKVTVAFVDLDARFEYVAVPTVTNNAYYKAVATNISAYQLLDGKMNVFVDNFFVANSRLLNTQPGSTFKLYLGVDSGIKVDCKPVVQNKGKAGMFTKTKHVTTTRTAVIKNSKAEEITALVFFQLPFTSQSGIKIKLEEPSKSDPNVAIDAYSLLKFRCIIPPGKEKRCKISYSIDHPTDKEIEFQPQRGNPQGM